MAWDAIPFSSSLLACNNSHNNRGQIFIHMLCLSLHTGWKTVPFVSWLIGSTTTFIWLLLFSLELKERKRQKTSVWEQQLFLQRIIQSLYKDLLLRKPTCVYYVLYRIQTLYTTPMDPSSNIYTIWKQTFCVEYFRVLPLLRPQHILQNKLYCHLLTYSYLFHRWDLSVVIRQSVVKQTWT